MSAPDHHDNGRTGFRMREKHHIVEALRQAAGVISIAAQKLNCHRQRLYEWIDDDPELKQLIHDIREETLDLAEGKLLEHIADGSEKSIHFYLKTIGRERGYSEKLVVAGSQNEPLKTESNVPDLSGLSKNDRDALRAIVGRAAQGASGSGSS